MCVSFLFSASCSLWRDASSGSPPNKWLRQSICFCLSSLASYLLPSTNTGTAQGGWPLPATHVHTKSYRYSLCHTHTHTHAAPFLLTYPELSRDRLAVTQCCPATSDLPESSERADPWLTTEIQLPNQAGRQERGEEGYGSKGGWAERKKFNWKFAILWLSIKLAPFRSLFTVSFTPICCSALFHLPYIAYHTIVLFLLDLFHDACSKGQDTEERKIWQHGRLQ